jgi:hypothetical protein
MKILIQFPTRRKDKFFQILDLYIKMAKNIEKVHFNISCDLSDSDMTSCDTLYRLKNYGSELVEFTFRDNKTKIEAINSGINYYDFDILLLASDDMIPQVQGYDEIIRQKMKEYYPDKDGVLWFCDGYQRRLNTLSILGYKYYKRFNYIYHQDYISLWSDNEFMMVADILKKQKYIDNCIIKHEHPANNGRDSDVLYDKNDKFFNIDQQTFLKRQAINFEL